MKILEQNIGGIQLILKNSKSRIFRVLRAYASADDGKKSDTKSEIDT